MITCSICGSQNDELAVLCRSCKSYLQSKVDTINLFETMWQLMESPRAAFKKIVLARHKNYVLFLSSLFGISMAYAVFWMAHLGNHMTNLFFLASAGALLGVPLGLVFMILVSALAVVEIRLIRGKAALRDTWAVASYSGVPVILSLVFVFPLEIAIFGADFFGTNPSPMVINPGVYMALVAFDGLAVVWSVFLFLRGTMVISGFGVARSIVVAATMILVTGGVFRYIGPLVGSLALAAG